MTPKPNGTPRRRRLAVLAACGVAAVMAAGCSIPTQSPPERHLGQPCSFPSPRSTRSDHFDNPTTNRVLGAGQDLPAWTERTIDHGPALDCLAGPFVLGARIAGHRTDVRRGHLWGDHRYSDLGQGALGDHGQQRRHCELQHCVRARSSGAATELAVSQVVFTVAAQNGAGTGVIFEIGGERTSVPVSSGAEVLGPVYALQFISEPSTTAP